MSTRAKLLTIFSQKSAPAISGTDLARRLGITRTAVWKAIAELEKEGYPVLRQGRSGYGIDPAFDLSLFKLGESNSKLPRYRVHYQSSARSTQILAKQAALSSALDRSLWLAEAQTAGRGRLDRRWESQWGGLWFSLLIRPTLAPGQVPPITLVAAIALCHAIHELTGVEAKLKWPNDIVVETSKNVWKKLAGILTEMAGDMDRAHWVVVGMGINVQNELPSSLKTVATTIKEQTGRTWPRVQLLQKFLRRFDEDRRRFERDGFADFQALYWKNYSRPNAPVTLHTAQGTVRGHARGVDAHGAIIIESRRQMQHYSEGEIV